ncbi:LexA family transcriptional regulator [Staphylococcus aureus]|uniref:LexA family transcriptional regulator n=17 Tax=Bacteria TaxID=2 RepID=UPI000447F877|nr:LexA family transcriptional regulator [Staphylococcus aureus]EZY74809.1 hypothetical protein V064_00242 [Staphylococcus aureus R0545]EZY79394.1 hypothetical protein V066_01712 [Staphylococcus aureus R0615]
MNSFKDRLKQIMSERKISQSELSRRTGIGRNSISDYLNGKYEAKQDKVFELAKALNVNEAWLMGFDISKNRKIENNDITSIYNKLTPPRQENVLNYANSQLDEQNKVTSIDEYKGDKKYEEVNIAGVLTAGKGTLNFDKTSPVACTQVLESEVPNKYDLAFQICGDSMEPSFKDGEIAYVLTNTPFVNKRVYAVEIDQEAYIKKVYKREDGFTLVSLNNDKDEDGNLLYPDIEVTEGDDFYVIGRVV